MNLTTLAANAHRDAEALRLFRADVPLSDIAGRLHIGHMQLRQANYGLGNRRSDMVKVYATRAEAQAECDKMLGWHKPHPTMLFAPQHPRASKAGFIIAVAAQKSAKGPVVFMQEDGYVK